MFSLLHKASAITLAPYPHLIIRDALPEDYYRELLNTRPTLAEITKGRAYPENTRVDMRSLEVKKSPWKEFVEYHTSPEFYAELRDLFGFPDMTCGPRGLGFQLGMECQPGINTPLTRPSKVRGPHLDNPLQLYGGMFYMPQPGDMFGGDLEIYRWKSQMRFYGKRECHESDVELVDVVPYAPNTFVIFASTIEAVHGVSVRQPTSIPRQLVNVMGDLLTL